MAKNRVEILVTELVTPITDENNFELVDVEYLKEAGNWYLRIYIDKEGGISVEDCEKVSRALELKLDEKDPITQAYILEVSSPGLDRPLKREEDFVRFRGEIVEVKLYKAINGKKLFVGELVGKEEEIITILEESGEQMSFDHKDIAIIRLAVIF